MSNNELQQLARAEQRAESIGQALGTLFIFALSIWMLPGVVAIFAPSIALTWLQSFQIILLFNFLK